MGLLLDAIGVKGGTTPQLFNNLWRSGMRNVPNALPGKGLSAIMVWKDLDVPEPVIWNLEAATLLLTDENGGIFLGPGPRRSRSNARISASSQ
jgi:hypothetical protein